MGNGTRGAAIRWVGAGVMALAGSLSVTAPVATEEPARTPTFTKDVAASKKLRATPLKKLKEMVL